ncbi:MAG: hypothetical protein HFJ50_03250 [Clostridia bacterium]|jgi:hypothetical protein|nr:hypothetical protein [Clostridia bacterium]
MENFGYYIVRSNSKYGVINLKEELIVHIEYDGIGVNTSEFLADRLNSQFILYDEIIPVYLNEKWGLFNIKGEKIADAEYDFIGCINEKRQDKVANNAIIVGDTKVIIVGKDGLYGGISTKGDLLLPIMFEDIYSITSGGETTYYMTNQGVVYRAKDLIDMMKANIGGYDEELGNEQNQEQNQTQNEVQKQENVQTSENNTTRRREHIIIAKKGKKEHTK